VGVETVSSPQKGGNWEDRKYLGKLRKSFVGLLTNAILFSRIPQEKVFQQPRLSPTIEKY
jgi:hypothetical protein